MTTPVIEPSGTNATPTTEAKTESLGKPTLHHLNDSQSQRILWLLEELGIEYDVVLYKRQRGRAPASLAKIHPLGKSPTLITNTGRPVIESAAITSYLLQTYDPAGKFAAADPLHDAELVSFASASLQPAGMVELFFNIVATVSPWPISWLLGRVRAQVQKAFTTGEFERGLTYLEGELGEREWFNGERLGRSDVIISFPLDMIAGKQWADMERWPRLAAWRKRVVEREAWKRGLERGNGYDLTKPPGQ